MDLLPTEEQQQVIDTAANFLASEFPVDPALASGGSTTRISGEQLQQIAQLGWLGIGLPEELDGVGYGLSEEALLFVELGRNLLPPSLLASVLGARIAGLGGASAVKDKILEGSTRVAIAIAPQGQPLEFENSLDGDLLVYEGKGAELILLADENGAALFSLEKLELLQQETCIDPGLSLGTYRAVCIEPLSYIASTQENIFLRGAVLTSALLLGIAEATLERSVNYAQERQQFGKAIGSFQAIKHRCADMSIRCESIRAMLYHASITLAEGSAAGLFDTYSLKALASTGATENSHAAVQIHGGMGFTEEMDIHLFVKRAQILSTLFGSERLHMQRLLRQPAPV